MSARSFLYGHCHWHWHPHQPEAHREAWTRQDVIGLAVTFLLAGIVLSLP